MLDSLDLDALVIVIRNRFPILVFGRSDIDGHLHPIPIAILSLETKDHFVFFCRQLITLSKRIGIDFLYTEFLKIDKYEAEYNAASVVFSENCTLLERLICNNAIENVSLSVVDLNRHNRVTTKRKR